MSAVPLIDLHRGPDGLAEAQRAAVERVLQHKKFILGDEVLSFEKTLAEALGGGEVIGVSSGTDALLVSLMALGVCAGDRVITTPFSFFATAGVIVRLGARPHFLDIEGEHFGLDPAGLQDLNPADFKAIVPVHLFGHAMELEPFLAWAGDTVPILEDAAQALGSRDASGSPAGRAGSAAAFSFFPTKNLGACGDAGAVFTRDRELAAGIRSLRTHGEISRYHHTQVGGNFRIDAIQAALLSAAFPYLDQWTTQRRANAAAYQTRFEAAGLLDGRIKAPSIGAGHSCHQYVVRIEGGRRDAVLEGLKKRGIGAGIYYPVPFHMQPCFSELGYREGQFPEAEKAAGEVLALPIFPGLRPEEQDRVVAALDELL